MIRSYQVEQIEWYAVLTRQNNISCEFADDKRVAASEVHTLQHAALAYKHVLVPGRSPFLCRIHLFTLL